MERSTDELGNQAEMKEAFLQRVQKQAQETFAGESFPLESDDLALIQPISFYCIDDKRQEWKDAAAQVPTSFIDLAKAIELL
eukprot:4148857-Ditylum_brightwellii.AAC.1